MRPAILALGLLLVGCAANPGPRATVEECSAEAERLNAALAAEVAERQRVTRNAARREEALRRQLEAMKAIERGILQREDRARSDDR